MLSSWEQNIDDALRCELDKPVSLARKVWKITMEAEGAFREKGPRVKAQDIV